MDPNARKATKGKGVDGEESRRVREDKVVQIRKDKRLDRANLQRRRFQEEDDEDEAAKSKNRIRARRNLENLPERAAELHSQDLEVQLDAATYFRKVLAIDKFPPVDLVVEAGAVPKLVEFLARYDSPKLQLEAAWAITNIACGELPHARTLVDNGAIPLLIDLISNSRNDAVREQSLWALGNITADVLDCRDTLLNEGIMEPLLWQLGINSPPHRQQVDSPSLSTMRHVTWACSNLAKGSPPPPVDALFMIVYALAELVQSPDEEMVIEACSAIATAVEQRIESAQAVLEQGIVGRIYELCDNANVREAAVLVLCQLLRSPDPIHRRVVLSSRYPRALHHIIDEFVNTGCDKSRADVAHGLRALLEAEAKYIAPCLEHGFMDHLSAVIVKGVFEVNVQAGHCLCVIVTGAAVELLPTFASMAVPLLQDLLSSTDPALLVAVLLSFKRLIREAIEPALTACLRSSSSGDIRDRIGLLSGHPFAEIASHASDLENIFDLILGNDDDDDS